MGLEFQLGRCSCCNDSSGITKFGAQGAETAPGAATVRIPASMNRYSNCFVSPFDACRCCMQMEVGTATVAADVAAFLVGVVPSDDGAPDQTQQIADLSEPRAEHTLPKSLD